MTKKIFLILIVLTLLFIGGSTSASENINIIVNGVFIQPDTPPQIINGRTMVPIRFVAEALGANVTWDENRQSVIIESRKSETKSPEIVGPPEFVEIIQGVLDLAKQKDQKLYDFYITNSDRIELGYVGKYVAMNTIDPSTKETVIVFDEQPFNLAKAKYSKQDLIMFHVAILAHESAHTIFNSDHIYTHDDEEALCNLATVRAIEKVGGKDGYIYNIYKGFVNERLKF